MNTSRAGWLSRSLLSLPVPYYPAEKSHNSVIGGREVSLAHSLNAQLLLHNCFPSYPTMTPHPNLLVLSFIFSYNLQIYKLSITNNDKTICRFHTPIGMVTMVSIQPLSSFWSRAPLSKAFTTSHLMMIWETYDIYIRLQLPYPTWCCCLLLLFVTCTCSFWTLLAETERRSQPPLSPVWWRGPQLVTLVTLVTLDQPQIETPPPSLSPSLRA